MGLHRQHRFPWAATAVLCLAFSFFGFVGANWPVQGAIRAAGNAASRCGERPPLTVSAKPKTQPTVKAETVHYAVVREGDNLWTIARRELGDGSQWPKLAGLNKLTPNSVLQPSQRLVLPSSSPPNGEPSHDRS